MALAKRLAAAESQQQNADLAAQRREQGLPAHGIIRACLPSLSHTHLITVIRIQLACRPFCFPVLFFFGPGFAWCWKQKQKTKNNHGFAFCS